VQNIPADLVDVLRASKAVAVVTGAGVSAESGIPTFRDAMEGLWARLDPADLATPEAFARDPELVSRWYDQRRARCGRAKPNPGHIALARLQRLFDERGRILTLITQNVDRLHQAAGSRGVIELHGNLWEWRCTRCGRAEEDRSVPFPEYPPRCVCGGPRRPGVVWFGEMLPEGALESATQASSECDLFLSAGTSAVVYPAAGLAHVARRCGASVCEINAEETPLSPLVDWSLRGKTGDLLPALVSLAFGAEQEGPPRH
jgi:NAD-dependent deacetylase